MAIVDCSKIRLNSKWIDTSNYIILHPDGRQLIKSWLKKASVEPGQDKFEAFIFLWIAFNSWGTCVTREDRDSKQVEMLAADQELNKLYNDLLLSSEAFREKVERFHGLWPIFRVQQRAYHRFRRECRNMSRAERGKYLIDKGVKLCSPHCWIDHIRKGEECPGDWLHVLPTIYRVRCNLFHGEKSAERGPDKEIVSAAYDVLHEFFSHVMVELYNEKV